MEHWELETLPEAAEPVGAFQLSQEETVKFGKSDTDGELYPVCGILCYEDIPYVTLEMANMNMTFHIQDTTVKYLTEYLAPPV